MRVNGGAEQYLASDQVSSTSLVTSSTGTLVSQTRYTPYGQVRWNNQGSLGTDKSFNGQRDDEVGLMDNNTRYVGPKRKKRPGYATVGFEVLVER